MQLPGWKDSIELIGLLAILLGLFFVYKEIEMIETVARAQLSADLNNGLFELDRMAIGPELAPTFVKANVDPESLTPTERWQLTMFLTQVLEQYLRDCYYESLGIFEECESVARDTSLRYFGSRYGRAFWQTVRNRMVGPILTAVIDEQLAENPDNDVFLQIDRMVQENLATQ